MARSNISIPFDRDVPVLGMVPDQNKPLSVFVVLLAYQNTKSAVF